MKSKKAFFEERGKNDHRKKFLEQKNDHRKKFSKKQKMERRLREKLSRNFFFGGVWEKLPQKKFWDEQKNIEGRLR